MTLQEAIDKKEAWSKAEDAVMKGQNYSIDGMSVTRVDLEKIHRAMDRYDRIISGLRRIAASGKTTARAVWS